MRGLIAALLIGAGSVVSALSQSPTPTPVEDDVVKISTNLIQVDVSVTDKDGRPIGDLRPDEIEIYENGQKQKITNFSFISSGGRVVSAPARSAAADKSAITLPPSAIGTSSVRRTIALVVDDVSLSWESIHFTRQALKKFVDEQMQEGDLVAILRTAGGVGVLQQFTTDKRILYAAIEKVKYFPMGNGGISALEPISSSTGEQLGGGLDPSQKAEAERFFVAADSTRTGQVSTGTLGSLQHIVSGMQGLPGRKSAIIFSDGFMLFEVDRDGTRRPGNVMQQTRRVIDAANRAAVVFYAVDPRGLQDGMLTAVDDTRRMTPTQIREKVETRRKVMWESQSGLTMLSQETGGFAVLNNNDISGGVRKALDIQSYYLIAYVPDSDTFDVSSKFNTIEVKVLRDGATARYRSGFFGATDHRSITAPPSSPGLSNLAKLQEAISSPFLVSGITLRLNLIFGANPDKTSYVRSLLHIDGRDLKFTDEKDGSKTCTFEVLATSFGDNGKLVDQIGKTYTMTIPPDVYQRVGTEGLVYHFKFPVKKPGAYQYRVAILDTKGKKIGAASQFVQVPDLSSGRLALSSIVVEDMSAEVYQRSASPTSRIATDPMNDTAQRRIKVGRVYRYSFEVYNAGLDNAKRPNLETRVRVYREGKLILDGQPKPFVQTGPPDLGLITIGGLAIGSQMEPGDYVLQVIVTDNYGKAKQQIASQFIQFEVVP